MEKEYEILTLVTYLWNKILMANHLQNPMNTSIPQWIKPIHYQLENLSPQQSNRIHFIDETKRNYQH
jgi:hypothetical protein